MNGINKFLKKFLVRTIIEKPENNQLWGFMTLKGPGRSVNK